MEKLPFQSEDAQSRVKAFCLHADWIRAVYRMYVEFFHFDDTIQLVDKSLVLYHLLSHVLVNNLRMEFAKVTDPAEM